MKTDLSSLQGLSDKALGGAMMAAAITVFVYYTTWAILVVRVVAPSRSPNSHNKNSHSSTHRAQFTRGSRHENGLSASQLSFWLLGCRL